MNFFIQHFIQLFSNIEQRALYLIQLSLEYIRCVPLHVLILTFISASLITGSLAFSPNSSWHDWSASCIGNVPLLPNQKHLSRKKVPPLGQSGVLSGGLNKRVFKWEPKPGKFIYLVFFCFLIVMKKQPKATEHACFYPSLYDLYALFNHEVMI